jgi:hypothetical protein
MKVERRKTTAQSITGSSSPHAYKTSRSFAQFPINIGYFNIIKNVAMVLAEHEIL